MENDSFFANSGHLQSVSEINCAPSSQQLLQPCFLNLNWDLSMDQRSQFGSDLGSMVSFPSTHTSPANVALRENVVLGEFVGKMRSICSSDEISPQSHLFLGSGCGGGGGNNCNTTTTTLNSSPKLNLSIHNNQPISGNPSMPPTNHLSPFAMDPGFTERVARFSSFNEENYGGSQMGVSDISIQDRSQLSIKTLSEFGSGTTNDGQFGCGVDDPLIISGNRGKSRKFKGPLRGKTKDTPLSSSIRKSTPKVVATGENFNMKRTKSSESTETIKDDLKPKVEFTSSTNSGDGDQKPTTQPEPPKQDFIHVRARRGQATDSHSLAERVRREKISERMKFLQDLVPGCNKVTGKAVMLDEIINYVQSLQRQVEFMSMKLATVNPRLDFNIENLPHKDVPQLGLSCETTSCPVFPFTPQNFHFQSILTSGIENSSTMPSFDGVFGTDFPSQVGGAFWDDDLQTVVQMGFTPNQ